MVPTDRAQRDARDMTRYRVLPLIILLSTVDGCAVGPDYTRPEMDENAAYRPGSMSKTVHGTPGAGTSGARQTLLEGADVSGQWWRAFGSPKLDALIARACAGSPNLAALKARLRSAYEQTDAQGSSLLPTIAASFNPTKNKTSRAYSPVPGNNRYLYGLQTAQLAITYQPDIWGGNRRAVESQAAQAEAQRFELIAATNTLINNVLVAVITQARLRAQLIATGQITAVQQRVYDVMEKQFALGDVSKAQLLAQRAALSHAQSLMPDLKLQLAKTHDLIAALIGTTPNELLPEFDLENFQLPAKLPVTLPSGLLDQRPDIRQAEARLHAATADLGVAIADRLPNVQLSAFPGQAVNAMNQFFAPGMGNWSIAAMVTQPIFQGGALLHTQRARRAEVTAAVAIYRDTVLSAIQDVADCLHALQQDADALSISAANEKAAVESFSISRSQADIGDISPVLLQASVQIELEARLNLISARADRYLDSVALFQAVGGGWWHRQDADMPDPGTNWKAAFQQRDY